MVESEEQNRSPVIRKKTSMGSNSQNVISLISPRFKSAAAMAGWDEEALLLATLIVEDTPDRDSKQKRRFVLNSKSPLSNSSRKRRAQRNPPQPIILDLDDEETPQKDVGKKKKEKKICVTEESKVKEKELTQKGIDVNSTSSSLPCMDKLREELSCAICLEICFEPSTTPCGHSFCRKCLRSAADKCGKKCPKCRQLISNGRSCTVNTVLWNTIQLLFPQEIEARKAAAVTENNRQAPAQNPIPETTFYNNQRNRGIQPYPSSRAMSSRRYETPTETDEDAALARLLQREIDGLSNQRAMATTRVSSVRGRTRRGVSAQDEDAAFALRLQREEFMHAFRGSSNNQEQSSSSSSSLARSNLRAMATRAMNIRIRDQRM
ncbi:E3 ubiquitin-protein ligase rnf168-like isoform X1 [Trifolium pratense]|nr:E3 ubiquitin-protein ligase rnf168-like isoform X1 [Trifolium pratense]